MKIYRSMAVLLLLPMAFTAGCKKKSAEPAAAASPAKHEHRPPHGGTAIVLGAELYHVELVREPDTGRLQAFVFDGELENFIRSSAPALEIDATVNGTRETLVLKAVANSATGETVGDTALFETQADWLKTTKTFDGTLRHITIRGTSFSEVKFNFPKGNDHD